MQTSLKLNGGEADEEAKPTIPQTTGGTRRIFRKRSATALASENTEHAFMEHAKCQDHGEKCDRAINANIVINAKGMWKLWKLWKLWKVAGGRWPLCGWVFFLNRVYI